ncbi:hypothetical protein [Paraburkholderia sp. ZP32-5]|uniref:hypothetical protein n=1 Tax=Paraburkholderia sp. ZP32-5 TaxID=2883245 RepID=UPI001F436C83|nr:hypothetical protein [Paraburkholderia sp. ZP32-5]
MFSLQRMIDDIGRKRQERRFASQAGKRQVEAIEHVFGLDIDKLKETFAAGGIPMLPADLPAYIEIRSLRDIGVNALLVYQTIEVNQLPRYIMTIRDGCDEMHWQHYREGDSHTLVRHDQEFAGVNMRLLTNDVALIGRLVNAGFNPPCPWIAFYELGPVVGSLQGNAEYWYQHIWDRYWGALSLEEQSDFLERKRRETMAYMSESEWLEWVDGLRFRDLRARD